MRLTDSDSIAQMRTDGVVDLFRRNEHVRSAVGMGKHKTKRHRRARNICSAHVKKPRHGIERSHDSAVQIVGRQPLGNLPAFVGAILTGISVLIDHQPRIAFRGLIVPNFIDGIARDRDQLRTFGRKRFGRAFDPAFCMHPWIEPDPCACGRMSD